MKALHCDRLEIDCSHFAPERRSQVATAIVQSMTPRTVRILLAKSHGGLYRNIAAVRVISRKTFLLFSVFRRDIALTGCPFFDRLPMLIFS